LCTENDIGTGILFVSYISKFEYVSKFEYTGKFKYVSKFEYKVSYINCVVLLLYFSVVLFCWTEFVAVIIFRIFLELVKKTETFVFLLILVALVVF
jgi:hypothetical protein